MLRERMDCGIICVINLYTGKWPKLATREA